MGETDSYWWRRVGLWLLSGNKKLIVIGISGAKRGINSPREALKNANLRQSRTNAIFQSFLNSSGLTEKKLEECGSTIKIKLDTPTFKFELSMLEEAVE